MKVYRDRGSEIVQILTPSMKMRWIERKTQDDVSVREAGLLGLLNALKIARSRVEQFSTQLRCETARTEKSLPSPTLRQEDAEGRRETLSSPHMMQTLQS